VHWYHYKSWRETGVAFEARYSKYICPNKTLASYLPGRKKAEKTSCLVRGYWGDLTVTPYIAMGIDCTYQPEQALLFKKVNERYCGHAVEVTEFNLEHWIRRMRTGEDYHKRFLDYYRMNEKDKEEYNRKQE
jgi:dynein assembly factor 3